MFCKKCGASIPDDCEFCSACGTNAALTEEATTEVCTEAPTEFVADTPVDSFTEAPIEAPIKTKKNGFFVKLACIVLAVAVIFTSVFFVFKDNMMGFVISVMPAEKQMQYTYSRLAKNLSNNFSEDYALALEKIDSSYSGEMVLDVEVSKEILSSFFADEEKIINKATLVYSIDAEGTDRYGMDIGIKIKDTLLANFQVFIDMSEQIMVMAMPGIIDGAVELDLNDIMDAQDAEQFKYIQTLTTSENLKKLLPKKELIKTILPT
ncbi:MAG: zinc ribbon domain-containing protein, partial [Clostridia bacterium]|nr:zinc ribbon domain-containing protein [Clostridia bacterium]